MITLILLSGFWMFWGLGEEPQKEVRCETPPGYDYRVVFHEQWSDAEERINNTMLVVDQDRNIRLLLFSGLSCHLLSGEILGQAVENLPTFSASSIPRDEVVFEHRRITLAPHRRIHVLLTYGPMMAELGAPYDSLFSAVLFYSYIFLEDGTNVERIQREPQGTVFSGLLIDDINRDGQMEIVLEGSNPPRWDWLRIWSIGWDGIVRRITYEGEGSPTLLPADQDGKRPIETRTSSNRGDRIVVKYDYYYWSEESGRYQLRSTRLEEIRQLRQ